MLPWKATEEAIKETPSRKHGIDAETETKLRIYGCELIQSAGVLLRLPQVAPATAQVLFQRFYFTSSFARHDVRETAAGCLFLSCKIVEEPKKTRDVCNVFHRLFLREDQLPLKHLEAGSEEYWDLKNAIIRAERWILKELGFFVQVVLPHKYVINFVKVIDGSPEVTQKAWNYANDSLRTTCCVQYLPEKIATTCIYLAVRVLQVPLPEDWFLLFDTTREEIEEIGMSIMKLYQYPKAAYIEAKWDCWTNTSFAEEVDPSYRPDVLPHLRPRKKPEPPKPEEPTPPRNQNAEQEVTTMPQETAHNNNKRSRSRSRERDRHDRDDRDRHRDDRDRHRDDRDRHRDRYRDDRDRRRRSHSRERDRHHDRDRYRRSRSPRDRDRKRH